MPALDHATLSRCGRMAWQKAAGAGKRLPIGIATGRHKLAKSRELRRFQLAAPTLLPRLKTM